MPVSDSAGRYDTPYSAPADVEAKRMVRVEARERPQAVGAEEFVFIEHLREHAAELGFIEDRAEPAARVADLARIMDERRQLRARIEEALKPFHEFGILLPEFAFEHRDRAERQQPDHGANLQALRLAVRQLEHVVKETVFFIPHARVAARVDRRRGDGNEVLEELERHVHVGRVVQRQLHADIEHVQAEERHPRGAVGLFEVAAGRQRRAAVEDADVVQAEEAALEGVLARAVLAVEPPGEVEQQLLEAALEPDDVALARARLFQSIGEDRGPRMDGRVHVAEVPLVGGDLAVRVQIVLAQHQVELLLAEVRVHQRERQDMEGEIPRRVPGILPLVRHGDDVGVVHVMPLLVARRAFG